jgi:hypothetical protein
MSRLFIRTLLVRMSGVKKKEDPLHSDSPFGGSAEDAPFFE